MGFAGLIELAINSLYINRSHKLEVSTDVGQNYSLTLLDVVKKKQKKQKQKWGNRWNIRIEEGLFYQNVRKTIEIKLRKVIKKGTDEAEFQSERQAVEGRSSVDNSPSWSPILSTKEALYSSISSP